MFYAIILAGGSGTRLWPLSRGNSPKQFLPMVGKRTLLEDTYRRVRRVVNNDHIIIVTTTPFFHWVRTQVKQWGNGVHIVAEPTAGRGTGAAVGLGLWWILEHDPYAAMVTINADAYVRSPRAYCASLRALKRRCRGTQSTSLTIVGIPPEYPETGYGYIECARRLRAHDIILPVRRFVEKPNAQTARRFIATGRYLWNTTMVAAQARVLWQRYQRWAPAFTHALEKGRSSWRHLYAQLKPLSFEYDILERETTMDAFVARGWGWSDVGHWKAVRDIVRASGRALLHTPTHSLDKYGNLLMSTKRKTIAVVGLSDTAVVDTDDALLVCPLDRSQEVRSVVRRLSRRRNAPV